MSWLKRRLAGLLPGPEARAGDVMPGPGGNVETLATSAEPWTMAAYAELVRPLPPPTQRQMQAFADFVSNAHSWYKHLPPLPPGAPLHFFLDPAAGMQLSVLPDGSITAEPRAKEGFHYSWLPTAHYRERFGHLGFSRDMGTMVYLRNPQGTCAIGSDEFAAVLDVSGGRLRPLPPEVVRAGCAHVTGLVHTSGCELLASFWSLDCLPANVDWPAESGGAQRYAEILERCRELQADPSSRQCMRRQDLGPDDDLNLVFIDLPLYRLLEPERRRQKAAMVEAMNRVVQLLS